MIDERSRRRADFIEGIAVRLEDGQEWHFPRPLVEFRARFDSGRATGAIDATRPSIETNRRFGERFWSIQRELIEAAKPDTDTDDRFFQASMNIAADLLIRNYGLSDDELSELLVFIPDDENTEIWNKIRGVACGAGSPKASPAG